MSQLLKGNFVPKKNVEIDTIRPESLEDRFEREALKRLGGSIAFVSKKKIMWDLKDEHGGK
jgi:predicted transcriptional regulator